MAHQNVKIKSRRNPQATAPFQQRMKQRFIVQNQIAGFLIGEKFCEALCGFDFRPEHRQDEIDIFSRELDTAVRLNHFHLSIANIYSRFSERAHPGRSACATYLTQLYSKIGSMQKP
jgi:hypothetical protein